ncbi:MAG: hypothetical protein AAF530_22890 [Pseudomonadota bacterium]
MFSLGRRAKITDLIEALEKRADELMTHEMDMVQKFKAQYADPDPGHHHDVLCLEVILRNVKIRRNYGVDHKKLAARSIEFERKSTSKA